MADRGDGGVCEPLADPSRLAVVRASGLQGPAPDAELDRYGNLARHALKAAACFISITDDQYVFVKSAVESTCGKQTPTVEPVGPGVSCAYVAATGRPLMVPDLRLDPRFARHALGATPNLAGYLGVPLHVRGRSIGAVCVMDDKARHWQPDEIATLQAIAEVIGKLIEIVNRAELSRLALRNNEVRYQALTEDAPLVVFQALADGTVLYVNPFTERFTGLPLSALRGMGWLSVLLPEKREEMLAQWRALFESGEAGGLELSVRGADGIYRMLHVRIQPVQHDGGSDEHWVGVGLEIEDRKQAEAQVRTSQNKFMMALDAGKLGFWDWNCVTHDVTFDGQWAAILGYELHELDQHLSTWETLVHPQDMARVQALLSAHLHGATDYYESEHRLRHRHGTWRWVIDRGRVVERAPDGTALRALGTHADITARKEAELALKLSEDRLQLAMEIAAVATWDTDLASGVTHWSKSHHLLLGVAPGDECESPFTMWRQAVPQEDLARLTVEWSRAGREQDVFRCEHRLQRRDDGRLLWVDTAGRFFCDAHGRAERFVGVCVDITERKQAEQVLQDSARRKDEFLAMLAHELRNPLSPIVNAVELMGAMTPLDATVESARAMIERQVNQLVHLVDDLLDVSRVSRGRIVLQKAPVNLAEVVRQAIEASRPLLSARQHQLTIGMPESPLTVDGDFTRLAQIVSNLLNNAAKYTDNGGQIEISLERSRRQEEVFAVIRVRDNGRGIASHALNNVFELFYQDDNSLDRAEGGLGIGLSLVKRLVENHGGRVSAHSAGRGLGSEFVVRLPCVETPTTPETPAPRATAAPVGKRILLVDDNRDATDSLALLLQMHGHDVLAAYEGASALDLATRERPAVILLDIGLPDMNGFELARQLRADPRTAKSVLIALTGYGQPEDREKSLQAGFDHHLVKPAAAEAILSLVPA
jgi:PAS domain S-box-containing protein